MSDRGEVLVLDDEETVCRRLGDYLSERGYAVETFTESEKALARLAEKTFDVIVTDLKMRGPTGMEVLRTVREKGLPTEVIMITGYGSWYESREAEFLEVFEFVPKPFRMKEIEGLVRRAAKKARRSGRPS